MNYALLNLRIVDEKKKQIFIENENRDKITLKQIADLFKRDFNRYM